MLNSFQTFLVLAPHTDDAELGAGATIAKLRREGKTVIVASFSDVIDSVPKNLPKDTLRIEFMNSMEFLLGSTETAHCFSFPVRNFTENRQSILDKMLKLKAQYKPEVVFLPSLNDDHQDHQVIAHEALRGFKNSVLLSYELQWNMRRAEINLFSHVTSADCQKKLTALNEYKSQCFREYFSEEYIKSLLRTRGIQAGCQFAEGFEFVKGRFI